MKTVYLDSDFKCHVTDDGTMTAIETDKFDGKCDAYIEGTRYVPEGKSWTRSDGKVFHGEMITLWKDSRILQAYQEQYEAMGGGSSVDEETIEKAAAYDYLLGGEA